MDHPSAPPAPAPLSATAYARRVGIAVGIVLIVLLLTGLLGTAFGVFLRVLAALLVALPLRAGARGLSRRTRLPEGLALLLVALAVAGALGSMVWLFSTRIGSQASALQRELPQAIQNLQVRVSGTQWGQWLAGEKIDFGRLTGGGSAWLGRATGFFSSTLGVLADFYVVVFLALFIALQPQLYRNGLVMLVPKTGRARAHQVLDKISDTLVKWVLGRLVAMLAVGVLTALGLWALGMPQAALLALFAGLVTFIPNIGPIISMVPALLLAFFHGGPTEALYVLVLYLGVQTLESVAVSPVVQQRLILMPPALIFVGQLVIGAYTGLLGLTLATPIVAIGMVLVKMLYVQDVLGDGSVEV